MKKVLIVFAALGAASGAALAADATEATRHAAVMGAQAASDADAGSPFHVTLYGVADMAIGKAGSMKQTQWGLHSNTIVTNGLSRIGMIGKEDLGGGLWAGFNFEAPVNLATGAGNGADPTTNAPTWNRQANVSLGGNTWGAIKLGRAFTPSFNGMNLWELTGVPATYSVVGNTYGMGGAYPNPRMNAQLDYKTPTFAGWSAEVAYVAKGNGALIDGKYGVADQTNRWDLNVMYANGPIKAAITANKANGANDTAAPRANDVNYSLGAQYKLNEQFAFAASYNHANSVQNWRDSKGGVAYGRRFGFSLGGKVYLGAFSVTLDLTRDTRNDIYSGKKYTNAMLEGKYSLSKHTFLYADYLRLDSRNNYGIGIRHNF